MLPPEAPELGVAEDPKMLPADPPELGAAEPKMLPEDEDEDGAEDPAKILAPPELDAGALPNLKLAWHATSGKRPWMPTDFWFLAVLALGTTSEDVVEPESNVRS